ncbi:hypothetical protein L249_5856, partial [Ophiocordyceps polyrhachis-furcata BCC 54312]
FHWAVRGARPEKKKGGLGVQTSRDTRPDNSLTTSFSPMKTHNTSLAEALQPFTFGYQCTGTCGRLACSLFFLLSSPSTIFAPPLPLFIGGPSSYRESLSFSPPDPYNIREYGTE